MTDAELARSTGMSLPQFYDALQELVDAGYFWRRKTRDGNMELVVSAITPRPVGYVDPFTQTGN